MFKYILRQILGFPGGSEGKESTCSEGDTGDSGSIPGLGRSPGGGHGNPLQYSCLENPMDREVWGFAVHSIAKIEAIEHVWQILASCLPHPFPFSRQTVKLYFPAPLHLGGAVLLFFFSLNRGMLEEMMYHLQAETLQESVPSWCSLFSCI